jgi:hypothetical protein
MYRDAVACGDVSQLGEAIVVFCLRLGGWEVPVGRRARTTGAAAGGPRAAALLLFQQAAASTGFLFMPFPRPLPLSRPLSAITP